MGHLSRAARLLAIAAMFLASFGAPPSVDAFSGFGAMRADATYGRDMTFSVQLSGGAPTDLELLLDFEGTDATFVAPVTASGDSATFRWDANQDYVTPNTSIGYRWRATIGDRVVTSPEAELLYDDDRAGLGWGTATVGDTVLHWVGGAEDQARHFGDLAAGAAQRAEGILGHALNAPVDIFVYRDRDQFFGALGPGAREWTGAAAYPELRTVFMYLEGNPQSYLDSVVTHEVTHVVFADATDNPYHRPARWLNEGFATWSEQQSAADQRPLVASMAGSGLLAFPAIDEQFPIDDTSARLAYAEGATMIDMILSEHGRGAMARLASAYRDGRTDAQALRQATGEPAEQLYRDYFDSFGAAQPRPVAPDPLLPSIVRTPSEPGASGAPGPGGGPTAAPADGSPTPATDATPAWLLLVLIAAGVVIVAWAVWRAASSARRGG